MQSEVYPNGEMPDRELVRRTLAGDTDALAVLHKRHYARVYKIALCRCRSAEDAEDVAGETFVRAIRHLHTYRFQSESLLPWLARIATNLIADQKRRQRQASFVSLDATGADGLRTLLDGLEDNSPAPQTLAERSEVRELLHRAIAELPHDQGEAILLRYAGDLPLIEIAKALNRSEGAVKSLLHRGLENLRRNLLGNLHDTQLLSSIRQPVAASYKIPTARVRETKDDERQ